MFQPKCHLIAEVNIKYIMKSMLRLFSQFLHTFLDVFYIFIPQVASWLTVQQFPVTNFAYNKEVMFDFVIFLLNCVTQCNVLSKDSHLSCDSFLTLLHYVLCTFMVYHPPFLVACCQYWNERQNFMLFVRFLAWCNNVFSDCIAVHSINMLHIV